MMMMLVYLVGLMIKMMMGDRRGALTAEQLSQKKNHLSNMRCCVTVVYALSLFN